MRSKVRKEANKKFRSLLKQEFSRDLTSTIELISEEEKTSEQQMDIISLRDKYFPGGDCPSPLFNSVSRRLQKKYTTIHDNICEILYKPSSITSP